jgi:hypothetical protein
MNAINFYFQQIEENPEVLVNEFNLDFLMVFSDSYNTPKTYTIGRCKVLELFPYPSLDDFSIKYDFIIKRITNKLNRVNRLKTQIITRTKIRTITDFGITKPIKN